ncbi:MAG: isochorismate synthase [Bacteroidales bacterium]
MTDSTYLQKFIAKARNKSSGFAVWFLPGSEIPMAVVQQHGEVEKISNMRQLGSRSGFVEAPFVVSERNPALLFSVDGLLLGRDEITYYTGNYNGGYVFSDKAFAENSVDTPKDEFIAQCSNAIKLTKAGAMDKVVLSRQKFITSSDASLQPASLLLFLKQKYPTAFVYLFYTPASGWWMGASPELLLRGRAGNYQTMALAGTRPFNPQTHTLPWPEKEQLEQKFVTDYILEKLHAVGITDPDCSAPYTRQAGSVEHICTEISFSSGSAVELLRALHPTPAVCGMPADIANDFILKTEKHDRAYYSGFLGMLNIKEQTNVYVNLRCMRLFPNGKLLFAGAGITAGSDPEREWNETEMKMQIMASAFDNTQNESI